MVAGLLLPPVAGDGLDGVWPGGPDAGGAAGAGATPPVPGAAGGCPVVGAGEVEAGGVTLPGAGTGTAGAVPGVPGVAPGAVAAGAVPEAGVPAGAGVGARPPVTVAGGGSGFLKGSSHLCSTETALGVPISWR